MHNKDINVLKKHIRVFPGIRTCFSKNGGASFPFPGKYTISTLASTFLENILKLLSPVIELIPNKTLLLHIVKNIPQAMGLQRHSSVLGDTVDKLSDEASYKLLFHAYRDEEALPSGEVLKEIIDLCRAILFPGYYGNARISKQTIRFHTGVNIQTLHTLLSRQIYAGLCFADFTCVACPEERISAEAEKISEAFISTLPEIRRLLATDVEATFNGDPAARDVGEVIFCYPGFRAIGNYRIAHQLYTLGVPYIPRMITEMAHSETGIDIHPGARIGGHFTIDHGTGTVIGETSVIGNHVRIFQGVSLAGEKLPPDENGNTIRGVARHPILEDHVTIYSNATLIGKIRIGQGATICGNVWIAEDVPTGETVTQLKIENKELSVGN